MLKKLLLCFVIPLIFAVCLSISPGNYGYGAYPINLCSENTSFTGYCVDCETLYQCNNGTNGTTVACNGEQSCRVSKTFAACSDINSVPECSCPDSQVIQKPDPYDDTKYFICSNGDRYGFQCPESEHYNPETEDCYAPSTTPPTTTTKNPCSDTEGNSVVSLNCSCFRYCLGGSDYVDKCCALGEIYNNETDSCEFYYLFNCTGIDDGTYHVDPHNCNVYYMCVNEEIFATLNCSEGEVYDEGLPGCSPDTSKCSSVPDCGICPDENTYIKIDCLNYYDCKKNEDAKEGEPEFIPVLKFCPEGTCFSQQTTFCELPSQSHWSFSKSIF